LKEAGKIKDKNIKDFCVHASKNVFCKNIDVLEKGKTNLEENCTRCKRNLKKNIDTRKKLSASKKCLEFDFM
jgi:hypothetical protein